MSKKNALSSCKNIRKKILFSIYYARSGHVGPSLSSVELIYSIMKLGINYKKNNRNKFILSKGHAAPALYAVLNLIGKINNKQLNSLRKIGSKLQGHPDRKLIKDIHAGTGALGQGLSMSIGFAIAEKINNSKKKHFVY